MSKRLFYGFFSLSLTLFLVGGGCDREIEMHKQNFSVESTQETIQVHTKEINEEDKKLLYSVTGKIPEVSGFKDQKAQEEVNKQLAAIATRIVDQFKKDVGEWNRKNDWRKNYPTTEEIESGLELEYAVSFVSDKFVSISFMASQYFAGSAHPTYYYTPFNYEVASGRYLKLEDLFKLHSNYLKYISDFAIKKLKQQAWRQIHMRKSDLEYYGKELARYGAAPQEENFKNFNLTSSTLIIFFDDAQVGSHAAGEQQVALPWKELEDIIDNNGPVNFVLDER